MRNFISEDMIEQAILNKLRQKEFGYDVLVCNAEPAHKEDLNDKTSRVNKRLFTSLCG
jgi:type I restriction enzyme R subunit